MRLVSTHELMNAIKTIENFKEFIGNRNSVQGDNSFYRQALILLENEFKIEKEGMQERINELKEELRQANSEIVRKDDWIQKKSFDELRLKGELHKLKEDKEKGKWNSGKILMFIIEICIIIWGSFLVYSIINFALNG